MPNHTPGPLEQPEKNKAVPRFVGVTAGLTSGVYAVRALRDMSLQHFISQGVKPDVADSYVLAAWDKVNSSLEIAHALKKKHNLSVGDIAKRPTLVKDIEEVVHELKQKKGSVIPKVHLEMKKRAYEEAIRDAIAEKVRGTTKEEVKSYLLKNQEKILRNFCLHGEFDDLLKDSVDKITKAGETEFKDNVKKYFSPERLRLTEREGLAKTLRTELATLKDEAKKGIAEAKAITHNWEKKDRQIKNVHNNMRYKFDKLKTKLFSKEIIEEMQLGFRHSKHRPLIFAAGAVALCAVGFAAYKITDHLMNGKKEKEFHQRLLEQRAGTHPSPGTSLT